ncbi:ATP-binding protein [Myxococcus sp. CA033]|uniref:AAA family ATPase n=1 Tax=Myxococcus sp. CA033 TaxID=2741516 RepID=UPI00157B3409|nr:ATP-binding protein [Myxococcus sp. CA033]NTX34810.1 ATP-binding protein [Myxococcus sp. CA033]
MKVMVGDTVVITQQTGNPIGIVTRRSGTMLTVRLPLKGNTLERVSRADVEPLALWLADARRRQTKFSNTLSLVGQSSLSELVGVFGYSTDVKMQRTSLGSVVRQLERAGLDVNPTTGSWDRHAPFVLSLKKALVDPSPEEDDTPDSEPSQGFALPQPFWPSALGLSQDREVAFLRALTGAEPLLALLYLPERRETADWLQATWEGVMGWAYRSAQRFVWTGRGENGAPAVVRGSSHLLHEYLKPSLLDSEGPRLRDAPHALNLIALQRDREAPVDLSRLLAAWPGPIFEFDATAIAGGGVPVSQLLLMVGGKPALATEAVVSELSPLKLVLWSREASAQGAAQAMNSWGDLLTRTPLSRFKGSNESSTSLSLKARLAQWLLVRNPEASLQFEQHRTEVLDDEGDEQEVIRTDLHVEGQGTFEVETLVGSGPMESFYHRKIFSRRKPDEPFSLVVPGEALLWAGPFLADIAHHLGEGGAVLVPVAGAAFASLEARALVENASEVKDPEEAARRESPVEKSERRDDALPVLDDVAGYASVKERILRDIVWPEKRGALLRNVSRASGILFFGPPGCGKSLLARAIAGELEQEVRLLSPSDLRGPYLGWGQRMIREQFDWVVEQENRMLVLDELDAVARSRRSGDMHSDEKADVNELLVQLDRAGRLRRIIVGTTNFLGALDEAVIRSGRFGRFVPVPPPDLDEAVEIVTHYLSRLARAETAAADRVPSAVELKAILSPLFARNLVDQRFFSGSDLEAAVTESYLGCALGKAPSLEQSLGPVHLTVEALAAALERGPRSVSKRSIQRFLTETRRHCGASLADLLAGRFEAQTRAP